MPLDDLPPLPSCDSVQMGDRRVRPNNMECDMLVKEVALYELKKKMENKLTDAAVNEHLRSSAHYMEQPHNFPTSLPICKKVLGVEDFLEYSVHYCPKYHRLFPKVNRDEWKTFKDETCGVEPNDALRFAKRRRVPCCILESISFTLVWRKHFGFLRRGTVSEAACPASRKK